jgi:hypothetical protein
MFYILLDGALTNSAPGQEFMQPGAFIEPKNHPGIPVAFVDLPKQFTAPAAWR